MLRRHIIYIMAFLSVAFKMVCLLALMVLVFTNEVHGQAKVFNVKDFGAIPDGKTDNSEALVSAWSKACEFKGDATVLIPLGNFRVSPVILKGPCNYEVMVELDGVLMAPSDPLLDSGHWITFEGINGLTVHGSGSFDGQGSSAWSHIHHCGVVSDCKSRPASVGFESITNGLVQGITSLNSKYFHFTINNCNTMAINNLKITAPGDSPNTDGIHVARSANIHISDTKISTGDDCISLGPGSTNISIWGILCGPGHGISIGSLGKAQGEENVSGINVRNCNISNTENGLRIKTWAPSPPSSVSDVTFEGITLNNANNPIIIDQRYCPYKYCSHQGDSRVQISNVKFIDISGSSSTKLAVNLQCSRSAPCKDIELDGIDIRYNGKGASATSFCSNAAVSFQGQQIPPPCL